MFLTAFLVIAVVSMIIVLYLFSDQFDIYKLYSDSTRFMNSSIFLIGTLASFVSLAFVGAGMKGEEATSKAVYLVIPLFSLFYIFWCLNLILRTELHYKGSDTPKLNGAIWLFLSLCVTAFVIIYGKTDMIGLAYIPFFWIIYCMYQWLNY